MELRINRYDNLLTLLNKEIEDLAETLEAVEGKIPAKLKKKIEDCKTFDYEDKDYVAAMTATRKLNLWIKFKDTDRDFYLILEPIDKESITSNKRVVAHMSYNIGDRNKIYSISMYKSTKEGKENYNFEVHIDTKSVETGEKYLESKTRFVTIKSNHGLLL